VPGVAHLRALALSSVFAGVATELTELTATVGVPPIGADEEEEAGQPRELVWLLDLPGQSQVMPPKWHLRLVLREPDIEDEAESRFVQTLGAGLFEVGESVDEMGASGAGWIRHMAPN
jgi:hypothetical protein